MLVRKYVTIEGLFFRVSRCTTAQLFLIFMSIQLILTEKIGIMFVKTVFLKLRIRKYKTDFHRSGSLIRIVGIYSSCVFVFIAKKLYVLVNRNQCFSVSRIVVTNVCMCTLQIRTLMFCVKTKLINYYS